MGTGPVPPPLDGLHDLGGKNGCPDVTPTDFDEDAKKTEDVMGQTNELVNAIDAECADLQDNEDDGETDFVNPFFPFNQNGGNDGAGFDGGHDCSTPFDDENDGGPQRSRGQENY